jgi:hypothetical protein
MIAVASFRSPPRSWLLVQRFRLTPAQVKQCLVFSRTGDFWVIDAEKAVLCGA